MKNVLIPTYKDRNPFFEEITKHSKNTNYTYGDLNSNIKDFDAVLIHWPEQLFHFKEPSSEQISLLNNTLKKWKKNIPIVHVVHNLHPHNRNTSNFKKLYECVLQASDIIVHLGNYSKSIFEKKYPKARHIIIEHPLYATTFQQYDYKRVRKQLKINTNQVVVFVPGTVRTLEERSFIINAFKSIQTKQKLLIVPRMYSIKIKPFKGYYKLKKIIPIDKYYQYFGNKKYIENYRFNFSFIPPEELSKLASASDIVFIPRIKNLNSGNTFLGLTFKKLIVGPNNGNTKEFLERHHMISFDVKNINDACLKLNEAYKVYDKFQITDEDIDYLHPIQISNKWDDLFKSFT